MQGKLFFDSCVTFLVSNDSYTKRHIRLSYLSEWQQRAPHWWQLIKHPIVIFHLGTKIAEHLWMKLNSIRLHKDRKGQ